MISSATSNAPIPVANIKTLLPPIDQNKENQRDQQLLLDQILPRHLARRSLASEMQYFSDLSFRISKERFIDILKSYLPRAFYALSEENQKIIASIAEEGYQDYQNICHFFDSNQVCIRIKNTLESAIKDGTIDEKKYKHIIVIFKRGNTSLKDFSVYIGEEDNQKPLMAMKTGNKIFLGRTPRNRFKSTLLNSPSFSSCYIAGLVKEDDLGPNERIVIQGNTILLGEISCSCSDALNLIKSGANINQYSLVFGSNPILLAVSKGWNHIDPDSISKGSESKGSDFIQRKIINSLLGRAELKMNCIHLINGLTPLHIACLRGDDLQLIQMLIDKGANIRAKDYWGRTPLDLLSCDYQEVQNTIAAMTGREFGVGKYLENQSFCATLPRRTEREQNIRKIEALLKSDQIIPQRLKNAEKMHTLKETSLSFHRSADYVKFEPLVVQMDSRQLAENINKRMKHMLCALIQNKLKKYINNRSSQFFNWFRNQRLTQLKRCLAQAALQNLEGNSTAISSQYIQKMSTGITLLNSLVEQWVLSQECTEIHEQNVVNLFRDMIQRGCAQEGVSGELNHFTQLKQLIDTADLNAFDDVTRKFRQDLSNILDRKIHSSDILFGKKYTPGFSSGLGRIAQKMDVYSRLNVYRATG